MQYFLGYSNFSPEPPFDASLFVEFRTRLGLEQINAINEKIHALHHGIEKGSATNVSDPKSLRETQRIKVTLRRRAGHLNQQKSNPKSPWFIKPGLFLMTLPALKTLLTLQI